MEVDGESRRRDRPEPQPWVITVRGGGWLADAPDNEQGGRYGPGSCAHEPELLPAGCRYTPLRKVKSAIGDNVTP